MKHILEGWNKVKSRTGKWKNQATLATSSNTHISHSYIEWHSNASYTRRTNGAQSVSEHRVFCSIALQHQQHQQQQQQTVVDRMNRAHFGGFGDSAY